MKRSNIIIIIAAVFTALLFSAGLPAMGASFEIPNLTSLLFINNTFGVSPYILMDMSFSGGLKYNATVYFSFYLTSSSIFTVHDISSNDHVIYPTFNLKSLYATVANLFDVLSITLFINDYMKEGYGGKYNTFYYTKNIDKTFDSVFTVSGYGLALNSSFLDDMIDVTLCGYQPKTSQTGSATINSVDVGLELKFIKDLDISLYAGTEAFSKYHWAISVLFAQNSFDILITTGLADTTAYTDFTDLYFLFEQTITIPYFYEALSIFSKPKYWNYQTLTAGNEDQSILIRFDVAYRDQFDVMKTGLYTTIDLRNYSLSTLLVAPYIQLINSGILWRLQADFNLIDFANFFSSITVSFNTAF